MSKKTEGILKIGTFYLLANIFSKAIDFFLLPVFTDLYSTAEYGVVSTYISYVNIISVFISLSLGNSLRAAVIDFKEKLDEYMSSIIVLKFLIAVAMTGVVSVTSKILVPEQYRFLLGYCLLHAFFESVTSMLTLRYMLESKYVKKTMLTVMPNLIAIPISILLIQSMDDERYMGRILGICGMAVIVGLLCMIWILIKGRFVVKVEYWKYAFHFSLPLIFHSLSLVILNQIDRTMLTSMSGVSETGVYSVALSFGTIAVAFGNAMENTWTPWFYNKMGKNEEDSVNHIAPLYTWTTALLAFGVMFLSPEVIKYFINEEYWEAIKIVPLIVAGYFFESIRALSANTLYYTKKTSMIAISSFFAAVINLVLNYFFIASYGVAGAAFTTLIAHNVLFVLQSVSAKQSKPKLFGVRTFWGPILVVILLIPLVELLRDFPVLRWGGAIVVTLIYVVIVAKGYGGDLFIKSKQRV